MRQQGWSEFLILPEQKGVERLGFYVAFLGLGLVRRRCQPCADLLPLGQQTEQRGQLLLCFRELAVQSLQLFLSRQTVAADEAVPQLLNAAAFDRLNLGKSLARLLFVPFVAAELLEECPCRRVLFLFQQRCCLLKFAAVAEVPFSPAAQGDDLLRQPRIKGLDVAQQQNSLAVFALAEQLLRLPVFARNAEVAVDVGDEQDEVALAVRKVV